MIRKFGLATAVVILGVLGVAPLVSAHVLKIDGNIGAVLHIEPDDDPISGQRATFELEFDDTSGKFKVADCTCKISVIQRAETVTQSSLRASEPTVGTATYTFSKPGDYMLRVSGTPKQAGHFQSFSLSYPVHVTSKNRAGSNSARSIPVLLWVGLGLLVVLLLLASLRV